MSITVIAILVPVIIGLVGVIINFGLSSKFAPLLCIVFGYIGVALLSHSWGSQSILVGIVTGLAATGTHSGVSSSVDAIKSQVS